MLRQRLVLFIALFVFVGSAFAKPKTEMKPAIGTANAQPSRVDPRGTKDAPLEVNAHAVQTEKEAAEESAKNAEQQRINGWNIGLTFAIALCALLQVCGIAAQVLIYLRQTGIMRQQLTDSEAAAKSGAEITIATLQAIKKQAEEMERQTGLIKSQADLLAMQTGIQQASLMQWVDLQPVCVTAYAKTKADPPERIELQLQWKLLNNTSLPFTVQRIETHVLKESTEEINVVEEEEVVPPAKEGCRNFYPFFIETDLNKRDAKDYLEKGILLTIQIEVSYTDATGQATSRFFGEHYWCEKNTLTIAEGHLGKTPRKEIVKDNSSSTLKFKSVKEIIWVDDTPESPEPN